MNMTGPDDAQPRKRRTKSVNQAVDIRRREEIARHSQPDKPCHKYQDSLFSWSSGFNDFSGFVNWGIILLLMGGLRLFLENLLKYGIRIDPKQWVLLLCGGDGGEHNVSLILLAYMTVPVILCLQIEKGLANSIFSPSAGLVFHIINNVFVIILPMVVITSYSNQFSLIGASIVCFVYSVIFLKLWSFVQVNLWCRSVEITNHGRNMKQSQSVSNLKKSKSTDGNSEPNGQLDSDLVTYPNNLTVKNIVYFLCVPTLCYELNFPRTNRIRKRFVLKRLLELVIGVHVMAALFQQWIIPSVKHALIPFSNMDVLKATERLLKLSIPNHLMWLIMFYLMFHSWFNFMGEILHFSDRNFYLDWWNSNNINVFWRKWNTIVHHWAIRHVYLPMIGMGFSKFTASTTVFFISAFFHEFLVSVPLQTFKSWAFIGMMMQVPLSYLSNIVEVKYGPRWGNIIVWLSLILGQPLCIMMYYHDYVISHYGEALLEQFGHL